MIRYHLLILLQHFHTGLLFRRLVRILRPLREDPDLMLKLTRRIGLRLKKTEDRLEDLVFRAVPARLARLLLELSAGFGGSTDHGTRLHFRITHQELANLIGSTRETVSAILGDFKRKGLIRQDHRLITIRDHERFAMLQ